MGRLAVMVDLADGLALRRLAERCADRGASDEIGDEHVALVESLATNLEISELVVHALHGDADRAKRWLSALREAAAERPEDDAWLVTALAALGNVIIDATADAPTGSFETFG